MSTDILIRPEREADHAAIADVIDEAFRGMPHAEGDEAELVDKLRQQSALTVSLVAELDSTVIGQIAFSPAATSDGSEGWYALGPLAVLPDYQGMGTGSALVESGLAAIVELGARGCILVGDPAYYARFGFELSPSNAPHDQPAENYMVKVLAGPRPEGPILFHEAFKNTAGGIESMHRHHTIDYVEFAVSNLEEAKAFYAAAFGWTFNDYGPEYAGIRGDDGEVGGLHQTTEPRSGGPLVILYSDDLDASLAAVKQAGGAILQEPYSFPGGRRFHFADPSGNELAVWSPA